MIDQDDIKLLKQFVKIAQKEGTDSIKVVVGDEPNTWIVKIIPEEVSDAKG